MEPDKSDKNIERSHRYQIRGRFVNTPTRDGFLLLIVSKQSLIQSLNFTDCNLRLEAEKQIKLKVSILGN